MSGIVNSPFGGEQGDRVYSDAAAGLNRKTSTIDHSVESRSGSEKHGGRATKFGTRPGATAGVKDQPPPRAAKRASGPGGVLKGKWPQNATIPNGLGKRTTNGVVARDGPQRRVRPGSVDLSGGGGEEAKDSFDSRVVRPVSSSESEASSRGVRREIAEPVQVVEVYTSASRSPVERPAVHRDTVDYNALPRPAVRNSPTAEVRPRPAVENGVVDRSTRPDNWYYLSSGSSAHTASTHQRPKQSLASHGRRAGGRAAGASPDNSRRPTAGDDRHFRSGGSLESAPRVGARAVDKNVGMGKMTWGEFVSNQSGESA